jgi:hypothetical protein
MDPVPKCFAHGRDTGGAPIGGDRLSPLKWSQSIRKDSAAVLRDHKGTPVPLCDAHRRGPGEDGVVRVNEECSVQPAYNPSGHPTSLPTPDGTSDCRLDPGVPAPLPVFGKSGVPNGFPLKMVLPERANAQLTQRSRLHVHNVDIVAQLSQEFRLIAEEDAQGWPLLRGEKRRNDKDGAGAIQRVALV